MKTSSQVSSGKTHCYIYKALLWLWVDRHTYKFLFDIHTNLSYIIIFLGNINERHYNVLKVQKRNIHIHAYHIYYITFIIWTYYPYVIQVAQTFSGSKATCYLYVWPIFISSSSCLALCVFHDKCIRDHSIFTFAGLSLSLSVCVCTACNTPTYLQFPINTSNTTFVDSNNISIQKEKKSWIGRRRILVCFPSVSV